LSNKYSLALIDLFEGLKSYRVWLFLSWQEVRRRYRRSILGPFWITISMGVLLFAMGPLYGKLLNFELSSYFRTLAVGFILWSFIVTSLNDSCNIFVESESIIKQIKLPYSFYIFKILSRNLIIFLHNSVIIIFVLFLFPSENGVVYLNLLIGIFLLLIYLSWISFLFALLATRYRDVTQLVASFLQVFFFLTPILWPVALIKDSERYIVDWNVFYHLIEIVRAPLLGSNPDALTYYYLSFSAFIGIVLSFIMFAHKRNKISYWI